MSESEKATGGVVRTSSRIFAEPSDGCIIPSAGIPSERANALINKVMKGWHMDQKPSVGRIVHYVSYGTPGGEFTSQCRAAIVTEVQPRLAGSRAVIDSERVGLAVLNPTGIFLHSIDAGGCVQSEDNHVGGTWHWPERV